MAEKKYYTDKKSTLKNFICILCSFLLAVSFTVIALLLSVKLGFANEGQVTKAFRDSGYYNAVYTRLIGDCENEATISGLSKEVFDGVFSLDEMTSYCNNYVTSLINNKTYELNTATMEETISENIKSYVAANNLEVDGDIETVISSFTSTIVAYYKSAVQFPYFDQIATLFRLFDKLTLYILPCMFVFAVILIVLLFRLNTFKKNRIYRYIAYSFLSASLSILVIPVASYITKFYSKLSFSPEYVYDYIITYYQNGINTFLIIGIIAFVLGILCIITSARVKAKLKKEHVPSSKNFSL